MAEAHSAVAFSFAITHEGWDVNFDREVLFLVWQSGIRSWKKRLGRFRNSVSNGVYPAQLSSLWLVLILVTSIYLGGFGSPFRLVEWLTTHILSDSFSSRMIACGTVSILMWLSIIYLIRYTLKLLFIYKGWMYETRGPGSKVSIYTRLWLGGVKALSGWSKPNLYSFQGSLPKLPLPSVNDTMQRYLRSIKPLMDDSNYKRVEKLAEEFEKGIAVKLQRFLLLKSWWSVNYVSDWWEEYVYLRGRSSLMINSNFYGIDGLLIHRTTVQAARAANVIYFCLNFRRMIERQELEPIMIQGMVPLCSWQYERIFNTTRVPGVETDKIVHYQDSNHIAVYHKGRFYKVIIYSRGRLLKPAEIQVQMQMILDDKSEPVEGEEKLPVLTAGERSHWAHIRQTVFNKGHNRTSLQCIETAAFFVTLDDIPYEFDEKEPAKLDNYGRILLHGKGYDRWFDKSFTLCFGTNGRVGFNAEHAWGDAGVVSHLWEIVIMDESMESLYDDDGNSIGEVLIKPPPPTRLLWDLKSQDYNEAVDNSMKLSQKLIGDLDLRILMYSDYGKGFMKKCRTSPDAFIQMALQLAYYRNAGRFSLTYEASMTRLFREGRTETVRPCTIESSAWVKAMMDNSCPINERMKLFNSATARHQLGYQDAMCGKGIDRHLFCLYIVSKYLELESPFLQEVHSEPWRLSTSQTPHGQTSKMDLKKYPKCISAGGGFGPVADDGYGVSYIIAGEDLVFFHISSKKSCPKTDSNKFSEDIIDALADIRTMFLDFNKANAKKA